MSTKQDDNNGESDWTDSGLNLLRRGLSVGKNVAIAGAAMSVAPVLVPPLLVFSAFGLALSVPFSIYFAGMVGTERLMGSLLPLDQDNFEESTEKLGEKDEDEVIIDQIETAGQEGREDTDTTAEFDVKPIKVKSTSPRIEESKKRNEKGENEQAEKEEQKKVITVDSEDTKASEEAKGENGSHVESTVVTDREESQYNKKQLWEQIRALRIVIGYKDPICKNLPDEMKALYQFTGVELPLTATDVTNIMDLNYKLHFLKSVIGVK